MRRYAFFAGVLSFGIVVYLLYDAEVKGLLPVLFLFACMFSLLMLCLIPGYDEQLSKKLSAQLINKPRLYWIFPIFPVALYLMTLITQSKFWGLHLLYYLCYILIPLILIYLSRRAEYTVQSIIGILTAAIIWIPFDHRWYKWFWPGKFPFAYEFCSLLSVLIVLYLFLIVQRQDYLGYRLIPHRKDFLYITILIFALLAIVIPIGVSTGFLEFKPHIQFQGYYLLAFIGIFLSVALVEEIIFRGIIQNLLEKLLKNQYAALAIASVLFGMTHWNNSEPGFAIHYIILASIAGVFYGLAYKKSGSLYAAIFLHALVDTVWLTLFIK